MAALSGQESYGSITTIDFKSLSNRNTLSKGLLVSVTWRQQVGDDANNGSQDWRANSVAWYAVEHSVQQAELISRPSKQALLL